MDVVSILTTAAIAAKITPALMLSVCFNESSYRNVVVLDDRISAHRGASHKAILLPLEGARPPSLYLKHKYRASVGICQVKLATAQGIDKSIKAPDLLDPEINARIAAQYLKKQIDRYHGYTWCGVNAYNAGTTWTCNKGKINTRYVSRVRKHMRTKPWMAKKSESIAEPLTTSRTLPLESGTPLPLAATSKE